MKSIKQTIVFDGKIEDIFEALTTGRTFSKISGGKTSNNGKAGSKFSAYDDYIFGTNVEIVPLKKIVQKWACEDFPKGHLSDVKIELKKLNDKQTEVNFTQENVPDELYEDLSVGWNEFYWEPIKDWLEDKIWG